jgi:polyphosphate kinase
MSAKRNTEPLVAGKSRESALAVAPTTNSFAGHSFLDRELSLLQFFSRVLEEALDSTQPLLERLKFLSILQSNLDEFFMIRVSGLKERLEHKANDLSPNGMTPEEQLKAIRERILELVADQTRCLTREVFPELEEQGIGIASYSSLSEAEKQSVDEYFETNVFPVLTPFAVDPAHPFPYISSLSLNLGLTVEAIPELGITRSLTGKIEPRFARIKIPNVVPRLIKIDGSASKFMLLEDLVAANAAHLFPRMNIGECHSFRVTRDADVEIMEDEAADLLRSIEQSLRKRRFGVAVRLEVSASMPDEMVAYLTHSFGLKAEDVYVVDGPLNISDLMALYDVDRPNLKDAPLTTTSENWPSDRTVFDIIRNQDVLLHHPYTSYETVTDFIRKAAIDPDVLAVKMCLYRTGRESPIPEALIEASEKGKQVTAVLELKARFDEENNIEWAKRLEQAGVHVVYGVLGLKTHCKVTQVVRREDGVLRSYVHIATGNYNPITSRVYTDLGLFTADEEIGADATELFNFLTGYSRQKEYRRMLVSPVNLRERMMALIEREIEHARANRPAQIILKINRLADVPIISALYEASRAGVSIDLIVRGICMLRPGVPGLSENIRVRSIVGRLLEHSRIFFFANDGEDDTYIGSADWMPRNLNRRVEVVVPIEDPGFKTYLKDVVLAAYLRDNVKARLLTPDGSYIRVPRPNGEELFDSQTSFASTLKFGENNSSEGD